MKIGILGTGIVGQTLAGKLASTGQEVMVGTRDVKATKARTETDRFGRPSFSDWLKANPRVQVGTFSEAASFGDVVINATDGMNSLNALKLAGESNLKNKTLIDIANPLDYSKGMPASLSVSNTDSLSEQIQQAFPEVKVVKTLNTMSPIVMVDPDKVAHGEHTVFISGNDAEAKTQVSSLLKEWFGWKHIIDLGDISTARGAETYLPLWMRLMRPLGTPMFNIHIVQ